MGPTGTTGQWPASSRQDWAPISSHSPRPRPVNSYTQARLLTVLVPTSPSVLATRASGALPVWGLGLKTIPHLESTLKFPFQLSTYGAFCVNTHDLCEGYKKGIN